MKTGDRVRHSQAYLDAFMAGPDDELSKARGTIAKVNSLDCGEFVLVHWDDIGVSHYRVSSGALEVMEEAQIETVQATKRQTFEFIIKVVGLGETEDEAWDEAKEYMANGAEKLFYDSVEVIDCSQDSRSDQN